MEIATRHQAIGILRRTGWWALFLIVSTYAVFALATGVSELLFILGIAPEVKHRALPVVFTIHALAGTLVLLIGPLQSLPWIRRRARLHRTFGRTYVVAVWIASASAVVDAMVFAETMTAKIMFVGVATLWFTTTTIGMLRARARRFAEKHEWMVRSYSLSLFFLSFSIWVPALASTSLPPGLGYPLSLFISGALNLAAAEAWIRWTRKRIPRSTRKPIASAFAH